MISWVNALVIWQHPYIFGTPDKPSADDRPMLHHQLIERLLHLVRIELAGNDETWGTPGEQQQLGQRNRALYSQ